MSEYREALQRLVNDGHEQRSYRCEECNPAQMGKKTERVQCPYHAAKALLARGEPEQGEMSDADVRRHYNTACDVFGIGSEARKSGYVLSTNCENAKRRSDCLSLIEREFFTSIEQDEEGEEGECVEKCELPWGAEPDRYVKKFGELLAARVEPAAAEKARELFRHKKTGNLYEVHGVLVDCTNSRDGTGAIIYGAVGDPPKYVRDAAEFSEKFEHMPSPPASKVEAEKAREQTKAIDLPGYVKPDNTERVHFYEQEFYVLSNFSAFNVQWNRQIFATSEHAYHWAKFPPLTRDENGTYVRDAILNAPSAHEAFKLAERFKSLRRADWDAVKVEIMHQILRAKADQHEYVRRKLLQTGDRELVEDSWRDPFWGWGPQRDGQNILGKLWMEIRAELRVLPSPPAATGDEP